MASPLLHSARHLHALFLHGPAHTGFPPHPSPSASPPTPNLALLQSSPMPPSSAHCSSTHRRLPCPHPRPSQSSLAQEAILRSCSSFYAASSISGGASSAWSMVSRPLFISE